MSFDRVPSDASAGKAYLAATRMPDSGQIEDRLAVLEAVFGWKFRRKGLQIPSQEY
jgi:hypothetical protein